MIIDASIATQWYLAGPRSDLAHSLASNRLRAPDLLVPETLNAIWKAFRFGAGSAKWLRLACDDLPNRFVAIEPSLTVAVRAAEMALELEHPAYDCIYLALAESRSEPLVTADDRFVRKIERHGTYRGLVGSLDDYR